MIDLYEFQREDFEKLAPEVSRLIASEMGTGLTFEAVALDEHARLHLPDGKTLVVGQMSTLETTWERHFELLQPGLEVVRIDPKNRGEFLRRVKSREPHVFITHWEALRLTRETLEEIRWMHIVSDEIQRIKNRKAQQTQALKKIKAELKTGLSGTPVTNKPQDYWSILNWLFPNQWRSYWKFYVKFVDYEVIYPQGYHKIKGPKNEDELLYLIDPYYVRHLKKEQCHEHHPEGVMPWLPEKYNSPPLMVELDPKQRRAYEQMNKDLLAWVGENEDQPLAAPIVVAKLMRLQQFAVAHATIDAEGKVHLSEPSSKLDALMDVLEDNPDKQFVIFSQFSQLIGLLHQRLLKAGISHGIFTGDTPSDERANIVRNFQAGNLRIFAGTIKAGGVGLDLFSASTVVFLDRSWSPAENAQAEDRLHRNGQENAVEVLDIVARDTIDFVRAEQLEIKRDWIRRMLGDGRHLWVPNP